MSKTYKWLVNLWKYERIHLGTDSSEGLKSQSAVP